MIPLRLRYMLLSCRKVHGDAQVLRVLKVLEEWAEKERWAKTLIRRAEETVIPGLSSTIEVELTASPLTNWAFTGNTHGALYGFEQSMDNAYMTRIQNETPIEGLYLAGAWWVYLAGSA